MFAIFKYKPSPFCVLDEIDAPLDDANIGRFVEMLQGMQDHTQFIIITHSRKTMEIADRLYGVTMEEPGVSKLISIRVELTAGPKSALHSRFRLVPGPSGPSPFVASSETSTITFGVSFPEALTLLVSVDGLPSRLAARLRRVGCDVNLKDGDSIWASLQAKQPTRGPRPIASAGRPPGDRELERPVHVEPGTGRLVEWRGAPAKASSDEAAKGHPRGSPDDRGRRRRTPSARDHGAARRGAAAIEVRYFIKVPPRSRGWTCATTNGGVKADGIANEVNSLHGRTAVSRATGVAATSMRRAPMAVSTSSSHRWSTQACALETVNGGVQLRAPEDSQGQRVGAASSTAASMSTTTWSSSRRGEQTPPQSRGQTERRRHRVELETTNGGIHITGR